MLFYPRSKGEITLIYITGDTHGETYRFDSPQMRKVKKGDTVIICGDFGFIWDGGKKEEKLLKKLGQKKYTLLFLDGTHENFDLLSKYPVTEWSGGKAQHISGNLYHLMRGQVYTVEGRRIFAFGGGESAEKQMRMEAGKWWPCEMPSKDEMREGIKNLRAVNMEVDCIVTHSPPSVTSVDAGGAPHAKNQLEAFFEQVAKHVGFKKWFFGSLHKDRKITYKQFAVFEGVIPIEDDAPKKFLHMR